MLLLELLDRTVERVLLLELLRVTDDDLVLPEARCTVPLLFTILRTILPTVLLRELLPEDVTRPVCPTFEDRVLTTRSLILRTACCWLVEGR